MTNPTQHQTEMSVASALMRFLANQWTVDGQTSVRTIPGVHGIFGHGNIAGVGQALRELQLEDSLLLPYHQARNEQAMVHQSVAYARMTRRLSTYASTASVGPGAANMLTGAALATANRLPALLLPSDTYATRTSDPVLQQMELPHDTSVTVNDAFRPLSRFYDKVQRPEQLFSIALSAMRVLTDPAETGAVTISLPQDVQTESIMVPHEFLAPREWHLRRPAPERGPLDRAIAALLAAKSPLIIAGGGVLYAGAEEELRKFAAATGIPVAATQAGVGSLTWDDPQYLGGVGATGTMAANRVAAQADVIIGIGTRYSDFTTGSRTAFQNPNVRFININVASFDAYKHGSTLPVIACARETLTELNSRTDLVGRLRVTSQYRENYRALMGQWNQTVDVALAATGEEVASQSEIIGAVQGALDPHDVVIQAAGSLPGDLHKLWRVRDALGYHVEYAFSCMGYEIPAGIGAKRAAPERDIVVMVGDGSYLMLHTELLTAIAEGIKIIVILIQNHGYASIGNLSETVGAPRFGTNYRMLNTETNGFDSSEKLPIDLAANARSYGVNVIDLEPGADIHQRIGDAVKQAKASDTTTLVHVVSNPLLGSPDGEGWWDVPVTAASNDPYAQAAHAQYLGEKARQHGLIN